MNANGPRSRSVPVLPAGVLLTFASLLFGVMAAVAKRASVRLPAAEVAFVRFSLGLLCCVAVSLRIRLRAHNWWGLFWRGAFGGGAVLCYFLGIEHLPVGMATLLNYTSPVFTALWAVLFLKERMTLSTAGALLLTTCGVVLVVRGNAPPGAFVLGRWELVGLTGAVLSGAAVATIREVRRTDGSWEIFAAFCVVGALVTGVPTARVWTAPTSLEWGLLVAVGITSVTAQILMTYALRFVRAAVAGIVIQLTPIAAYTLGWICYGERAAGLSLVGVAVTLIGVTVGAWLAAKPDPAALRAN